MGELLDAVGNLLENIERGLTIFTAGSFLIVILKLVEGYKQKRMEAEMRRDIKAIKQKLGVEECGPQSECQTAQASLRRLYRSFSGAVSRVEYQFQRRGKAMQINKTWLVGLLGYVAFFVKQFTGYAVPDAMINSISDLVLIVIGLIPMFMNMTKKPKEVQQNGFGVQSEDNR